MPNQITRRSLSSAVRRLADALLDKGDRWYPQEQENILRADLYAGWQNGLQKAVIELARVARRGSPPVRSEIDEILSILKKYLSRISLIAAGDAVRSAFTKGKDEASSQYRRAGGKERKAEFGFGVLFGLTEQHALTALGKFVRLSAGGFWDDEMSEIVRNELESWFDNESMNRSTFAAKLKELVNDRLSTEGKKSLPASYFEGLAEQTIVRTRSMAKVYRGKELGATGYRLRNPRDKRTSSICMTLADGSTIYSFEEAEKEADAILTATSLKDLKAKVPFRTSATSKGVVTPPFHWRCRTSMELVFEGLND